MLRALQVGDVVRITTPGRRVYSGRVLGFDTARDMVRFQGFELPWQAIYNSAIVFLP